MPGPQTVYGDPLARAVRDGEVDEAKVDDAVRNVLRLAARVGVLRGAEPAVTALPEPVDGQALAREIARRAFVLVRNERGALPLKQGTVALLSLIHISPDRLPAGRTHRRPPRGHPHLRRRRRPEHRTRRRRPGLRAAGRVPRRRRRRDRHGHGPQRSAPVDGRRPARGRHPRHPPHRRTHRHLHPARVRPAHLRRQGAGPLHPARRRHHVLRRRPTPRQGRPVPHLLRRPGAPRAGRTHRGPPRRGLPHPGRPAPREPPAEGHLLLPRPPGPPARPRRCLLYI